MECKFSKLPELQMLIKASQSNVGPMGWKRKLDSIRIHSQPLNFLVQAVVSSLKVLTGFLKGHAELKSVFLKPWDLKEK